MEKFFIYCQNKKNQDELKIKFNIFSNNQLVLKKKTIFVMIPWNKRLHKKLFNSWQYLTIWHDVNIVKDEGTSSSLINIYIFPKSIAIKRVWLLISLSSMIYLIFASNCQLKLKKKKFFFLFNLKSFFIIF